MNDGFLLDLQFDAVQKAPSGFNNGSIDWSGVIWAQDVLQG